MKKKKIVNTQAFQESITKKESFQLHIVISNRLLHNKDPKTQLLKTNFFSLSSCVSRI